MKDVKDNLLRKRIGTAGLHGATFRQSKTRPVLGYYLYRPESPVGRERILVSIHGVSRNAGEHIELFKSYADRYGVVLIAPLFEHDTFPDYQRLGRRGKGPRADLALIRLLNELMAKYGWDTSQVDLFGFSGGAQFVHRFAFAHSQRVRSMSLGAAGWYTMPDKDRAYPYGIADAEGLESVRFNAAAAARLHTLLMVGEYDNCADDEELNQSRIVRKMQGLNRVQRARAWSKAMNAISIESGEISHVDMVELPEVNHSFRNAVLEGGMATLLFNHCFASEQVQWNAATTIPETSSGQHVLATS